MDSKIEERVKVFTEELKPLLKKYHLQMGALPTFPRYNILPNSVKLALEVLKDHEVEYHTAFQELKNDTIKETKQNAN